MKDRDMGFYRSLQAEAARMENALELAEAQTSRFPRDHSRERKMERAKAHLARIEKTLMAEMRQIAKEC